MPGPSRRRSNQWVIPLAVTATAAVATAALWWWTEHSSESRSPQERLAYDSDYDPTEDVSPPGSTSTSKTRSGSKGGKRGKEEPKKKEKLPDVREETESEREKRTRSVKKETSAAEAKAEVKPFGGLNRKRTEDSSGYASGYASEGGRSRSVSGGVLSRSSLVSQEEIKRYVPPARKRNVMLVVAEKDLGRNPSDDQIFQVQKSSLLSFLRPPLINEASTQLFFILHRPSPNLTATPILSQAKSLMPPTYPPEFFMEYDLQPEGLINMLRGMEPQIVYVEQSLAGENGELVEALLDKSWVGYVAVVLGGGGALEGLVDTETEDEGGAGRKRWWEIKGGVLDKFRGRCSVVERVHLADDWQKRILDRT